MKYGEELGLIRRLLDVDQTTFAQMIGVSFETVNRWELNKIDVDDNNLNNILNCAFENGIYVNEIYEQFLTETYENKENVVLFHGSKDKLELPIDLVHSKYNNDFGKGFYLGERLDQTGNFICRNDNPRAYAFCLKTSNLKILDLSANLDWLISVLYYRHWIDDKKDNKTVNKIIKQINEADAIKAPIADNKMYNIINDFVKGNINDQQCIHALSAINLGKQYVIKTKKGLNNLKLIKEFYLSSKERDKYIKDGIKLFNNSQEKVEASFIKYRRKGNYIWEVLK